MNGDLLFVGKNHPFPEGNIIIINNTILPQNHLFGNGT